MPSLLWFTVWPPALVAGGHQGVVQTAALKNRTRSPQSGCLLEGGGTQKSQQSDKSAALTSLNPSVLTNVNPMCPWAFN